MHLEGEIDAHSGHRRKPSARARRLPTARHRARRRGRAQGHRDRGRRGPAGAGADRAARPPSPATSSSSPTAPSSSPARCRSTSTTSPSAARGIDKTILDFGGQEAGTGGEGLQVTSDGFTIEDLTVQNTKGDGIKVEGADSVTFRNIFVELDGRAQDRERRLRHLPGAVHERAGRGQPGARRLRRRHLRRPVEEHHRAPQQGVGERGRHRDRELVRRRRLRQRRRPTTPAASWCSTCPRCRSRTAATRASSATRSRQQPSQLRPRGRHRRDAAAGHRHADHGQRERRDVRERHRATTTATTSRSSQLPDHRPRVQRSRVRPVRRGDLDPRQHVRGRRPASDRTRGSSAPRSIGGTVCRTSSTTASLDPAKMVDGKVTPELGIYIANNGDADFINLDLGAMGAAAEPKPSKDVMAHAGALPDPPRRDRCRVRGWRSPISAYAASAALLSRRCVATRLRRLCAGGRAAPATSTSSSPNLADAPQTLSVYELFEGEPREQRPAAGVVPYDLRLGALLRLRHQAALREAAGGQKAATRRTRHRLPGRHHHRQDLRLSRRHARAGRASSTCSRRASCCTRRPDGSGCPTSGTRRRPRRRCGSPAPCSPRRGSTPTASASITSTWCPTPTSARAVIASRTTVRADRPQGALSQPGLRLRRGRREPARALVARRHPRRRAAARRARRACRCGTTRPAAASRSARAPTSRSTARTATRPADRRAPPAST